mgnify:CR=1 FL=1
MTSIWSAGRAWCDASPGTAITPVTEVVASAIGELGNMVVAQTTMNEVREAVKIDYGNA